MRLNRSVSGPGTRQNGETMVFAPIVLYPLSRCASLLGALETGSAFSCLFPSCEDSSLLSNVFFCLFESFYFTSYPFTFIFLPDNTLCIEAVGNLG